MDKLFYVIISITMTGVMSLLIWMVQRAFNNVQKTIENQNNNFTNEFKQLNTNIVKTNESILKFKLDANKTFAEKIPNTNAHMEIWKEFRMLDNRMTRQEGKNG